MPPVSNKGGKKRRGYSCLLIETHYDFFICIPYRTGIRHKYAYHFKNSKRSKEHCSGLGFTKMIIIKDEEFIDNKETEIDADEYAETRKNIYQIVKGALIQYPQIFSRGIGIYAAKCFTLK